MSARSAAVAKAERLLAYEGARAGDAEALATAAGRVYDRLSTHLVPLLGANGVEMLFARSAKLQAGECAGLAEIGAHPESPTKLRECLQALDPAAANDAAVRLFGTFLTLMGTFIGERLTNQVLRGAWPAIGDEAPGETKK